CGWRATVGSVAVTDSFDHLRGAAREFTTTHWSVVLATREVDEPRATMALDKLCGIYWYPLYAYLRRRGHGEHDAQDLTQGFFAQLLDRGSIQKADREKGRFRSFLLARSEEHTSELQSRLHLV